MIPEVVEVGPAACNRRQCKKKGAQFEGTPESGYKERGYQEKGYCEVGYQAKRVQRAMSNGENVMQCHGCVDMMS